MQCVWNANGSVQRRNQLQGNCRATIAKFKAAAAGGWLGGWLAGWLDVTRVLLSLVQYRNSVEPNCLAMFKKGSWITLA